jgi:hypothetical protein
VYGVARGVGGPLLAVGGARIGMLAAAAATIALVPVAVLRLRRTGSGKPEPAAV